MQTGIIRVDSDEEMRQIRQRLEGWEQGDHGPMVSSGDPSFEEMQRWGLLEPLS